MPLLPYPKIEPRGADLAQALGTYAKIGNLAERVRSNKAQESLYGQRTQMNEKIAERKRDAEAYKLALETATSEEDFNKIYTSAGGSDKDVKFVKKGNEVEITSGDWTLKGNNQSVRKLFDVMSKNPDVFENKQSAMSLKSAAASMGISLTRAKQPEKKEYTTEDIGRIKSAIDAGKEDTLTFKDRGIALKEGLLEKKESKVKLDEKPIPESVKKNLDVPAGITTYGELKALGIKMTPLKERILNKVASNEKLTIGEKKIYDEVLTKAKEEKEKKPLSPVGKLQYDLKNATGDEKKQLEAAIDKSLTDPLYAQAVKMVEDDLTMVGKTGAEKVRAINNLYNEMKRARSGEMDTLPAGLTQQLIDSYKKNYPDKFPTDESVIEAYKKKKGIR